MVQGGHIFRESFIGQETVDFRAFMASVFLGIGRKVKTEEKWLSTRPTSIVAHE